MTFCSAVGVAITTNHKLSPGFTQKLISPSVPRPSAL